MKTDFERLMECVFCEHDPKTCNCDEEDETGSCVEWKPIGFTIDTEKMKDEND